MVQTWGGENWFKNFEYSLWITLNTFEQLGLMAIMMWCDV